MTVAEGSQRLSQTQPRGSDLRFLHPAWLHRTNDLSSSASAFPGLKARSPRAASSLLSPAIVAAIIVALSLAVVPKAKGQEAIAPTNEELAGIAERGRLLYEYDQAAWHAADAVQLANPNAVDGQVYIAKKENGKWLVVFGKLNDDRSRFAITYQADEQ